MPENEPKLNEETIDTFQDLLEVNYDSRDGFREVAEKVDDSSLATVFRRYADQRSENIKVLEGYVTRNNKKAEDDGSFAAKVHRSWISCRDALSGDSNRKAMLQEAERGEDHIKSAYEDALKKTAGSAVTDVLNKQFVSVKASHDEVKRLRDAVS